MDSWAQFNVIVTTLSLVIVFAYAIKVLFGKTKNKSIENIFTVDTLSLVIAGFVCVVAESILFLTQDFSGQMIAFDSMSVLYAVLLIVQLLTPMAIATINHTLVNRVEQKQ